MKKTYLLTNSEKEEISKNFQTLFLQKTQLLGKELAKRNLQNTPEAQSFLKSRISIKKNLENSVLNSQNEKKEIIFRKKDKN